MFRKFLFEILYKNRYLYRFASTVPFAGQWRVWQRLVLPRLHGQDVLELGCGLGDLLADLLSEGYHCQAIEHSPQMVDAARSTLRKRKLGEPQLIQQGSAQNLPFPDASFDSIVSTFPSEYIADPKTIAEAARVLRPGGRLIIVLGANLHPVGLLQPLLIILHTLVYGPKARHQSLSADEQYTIITEALPKADFGHLIPLEHFNLQRRAELVHCRRWETSIIIGEKF